MAKPPVRQEGSSTFKEKFKSIFGIRQSTSHNVTVSKQTKKIIFTSELLKEIGPESPANHRLKTIRELCDVVATRRLEENATETLWLSVGDLLQPQVAAESRHVALKFLQCLIKGQYDKLGTLRAHFFEVLRQHNYYEDLPHRLEVFITLTENGKDLTYIEEDTGPFLLQWMPDVISSGRIAEFLGLLMIVIKHNAAYLDPHILSGLVQYTCTVSNRTKSEEDLKACIDVFNAVVCYSHLPSDALHNFIVALCRLVNLDKFCQATWKLMKNLLGTHLGHSGIYTMCYILQDRQNASDPRLLRGAIFFIGMAMWGSKKVLSLKHPPSTVLPCLLTAVQHCSHLTVVYEVLLSLQRLVKKYGKETLIVTWQIILDIIETLLRYFETSPSEPAVQKVFHDVLSSIEQFYEQGEFTGDQERFFAIIERCANKRPESSVLVLISFKAQALHPAKASWIANLNRLVEKYFKDEYRTEIRNKALDVLSCVLSANRHLYEDELIHIVVLPHLSSIDSDQDLEVRKNAVQLLLDLAQGCQTQRCADLLEILERVVNRSLSVNVTVPHTGSSQEQGQCYTCINIDEDSFSDIKTAALGLVTMFKTKLFQLPSSHAGKIYDLMISILKNHYRERYMSKTACSIREAIFGCLLSLRADTMQRLGVPRKDNQYYYSSYILCDGRPERLEKRVSISNPPSQVSPVPSPIVQLKQTTLPYSEAFNMILTALEQELDWPVLKLVLEKLPLVLQNKTLILSCQSYIERLCKRLCDMVSDKTMLAKLQNTPTGFILLDFHTYFFPPLTCLALYHNYLDKSHRIHLIRCLEFGLISRCAQISISALTVCMLEMQDTMMRQLPAVLLKLSKTSSTVSVASPKLEFLSSLIRLPKLYANFVEEQYMSIFAIALPYTNLFKFNHYTVSLAHHLIAMWFLKCRLPFRKTFVTYINRNLRSNVINQFDETAKLNLAMMNQDSSDRRRLRSFGDGSLKRKPIRPVSIASHVIDPQKDFLGQQPQAPPLNEEKTTFHKELTETCLDMMARYTFSSCSSMPKRSPVAEFLLKGGQSQSWLVGNKIITITTSGGGSRVGKGGLCEKCVALCKTCGCDDKETKKEQTAKAKPSDDSQKQSLASKRRRHKSAAVQSVSIGEVGLQKPTSKDDIQLFRQLPEDCSNSHQGSPCGPQSASPCQGSPCGPQSASPQVSTTNLASQNEEDVNDLLLGWKRKESDHYNPHHCSCWCQGWAEVYIRRPTGNISWMMRIQNDQLFPLMMQDFPLDDISTLFRGSHNLDETDGHVRIDSESLGENEYETLFDEHFQTEENRSHRFSRRPVTTDDIAEGQLDMDLHDDVYTVMPNNSLTTESVLQNSVENDGLTQSFKEETQDSRSSSVHTGSISSLRKTHSSPNLANDYDKFLEEVVQNAALTKSYDHSSSSDSGENPEIVNSEAPPTTTDIEENGTGVALGKKRHRSEGSSLKTRRDEIHGNSPYDSEDASVTADESPELGHPGDDRKIRHSPFVDLETKEEVVAGEVGHDSGSLDGEEDMTDATRRESTDLVHDLQPAVLRRSKPRGHTIAVIPSVSERSRSDSEENKRTSLHMKEMYRTGLTPSFVFLMLYHSPGWGIGDERPLTLPQVPVIDRAVKVLDHIPPYETHKIGIIYVGAGQADDQMAILSNAFGSSRYAEFLHGLGELLRLRDCDPEHYIGGLDTNGSDGQFTYCWRDDVMQVIFHVATLMPNRESDPHCNAKKLHIGNDYVTIVYNNSNEDYKMGTIKGQFNYVNIVIQPLDYGSNAVSLVAKDEVMEMFGQTETKIISDERLPVLTRQMALHANLASMILQRQKTQPKDPYASNCLERLRQIKKIRQKALQESSQTKDDSGSSQRNHHNFPEDFTDYV